MFLNKEEIKRRLQSAELRIDPILDFELQIHLLSIDLRLGYNFLVPTYNDSSTYLDVSSNESIDRNGLFEEKRKRFGDSIFLLPTQTVLATTLEYIKLPDNVIGFLTLRNSYSRLGLTSIYSVIKPNHRGCISVELNNLNRNPINLKIGASIFQLKLANIKDISASEEINYYSRYFCNVRPVPSKASLDKDLAIIEKCWENNNHFE